MHYDELKKAVAKKIVRLRARNDGLWVHIRNITPLLINLAEKHGSYDENDMKTFRLCLGIILTEMLVHDTELIAGKLLTPDEEDKYGRTNP